MTLEDALEEIVGEIISPGEAVAEMVQKVAENEYLLAGNLPIHEWTDVFGIDLRVRRVSTIGGLVMSLLGRVPQADDTVAFGNLQFTVRSVHHRRIRQVRLVLKEEQP